MKCIALIVATFCTLSFNAMDLNERNVLFKIGQMASENVHNSTTTKPDPYAKRRKSEPRSPKNKRKNKSRSIVGTGSSDNIYTPTSSSKSSSRSHSPRFGTSSALSLTQKRDRNLHVTTSITQAPQDKSLSLSSLTSPDFYANALHLRDGIHPSTQTSPESLLSLDCLIIPSDFSGTTLRLIDGIKGRVIEIAQKEDLQLKEDLESMEKPLDNIPWLMESPLVKIYAHKTADKLIKNPLILSYVNCYFLRLMKKKDSFLPFIQQDTIKKIEKIEQNDLRNECVNHIEALMNEHCDYAIKWPRMVNRVENGEAYYSQLLTNSALSGKVNLEKHLEPFSAGIVATALLYQIEQDNDLKDKLLCLTDKSLYNHLNNHVNSTISVLEGFKK